MLLSCIAYAQNQSVKTEHIISDMIKAHGIFFVVFAPDYSENCGGCVVLHYLVDRLNSMFGVSGPIAFIVPRSFPSVPATSIDLNPGYSTPVLPSWYNASAGIVIYPESLPGNPVKAQRVIRWVLYFPGIHGNGPVAQQYLPHEMIVCYSPGMCNEFVGRLPTHPLRIIDYGFHTFKRLPDTPRDGTILLHKKDTWMYAGQHVQRAPGPVMAGEVLPLNLTKRARAEIFARSEMLISYDAVSFISIEAAMAGCISVVVPVENVTKEEWLQIAYGREFGVAYGMDDLKHAIDTLPRVMPNLVFLANRQVSVVNEFVLKAISFFTPL
jgi:hypothetical protein